MEVRDGVRFAIERDACDVGEELREAEADADEVVDADGVIDGEGEVLIKSKVID